MAFCKYCGSNIPDEVSFCPKCGKKLSNNSQSDDTVLEKLLPRWKYFAKQGSSASSKLLKTNQIVLAVSVGLRIAALLVHYGIMFPSGALQLQLLVYGFSGMIFSATGLSILLMALACLFKNRFCAIAAIVFSAYKTLNIGSIPLFVGNAFILVASIIILLNTIKLEKEYRTYISSVE